jgi:hypothetical protein
MATHVKTYAAVICPRCGQIRQVRTDVLCKSNFTGQCKKCHAETSIPPHYFGSANPAYKKGWFLYNKGYVWLSINGVGIAEHRLIMERHLKRPLQDGELVHHKNGDKADNRPGNLEICTKAEHINIHRDKLMLGRRLKKCQRKMNQTPQE